MKSALGLVLGVCTLVAVGCAGSEDNTGNGVIAASGSGTTGGSGNSAGTGVLPSAGTGTTPGTGGTGTPPAGGTSSGGTGTPAAGVPLIPMMGWVAKESNTLGIQGAMFSFGDKYSKAGPPMMTDDFTESHACIKGAAAKVVMGCTIEPPATDCYGTYWGAAIGLNMNQAIDMTTMMGGDPMPFDGSAIKGFGFTIEGTTVPAPKDLRFKVEGGGDEYCNPATKQIKAGANTFMLDDLITKCYKPAAGAATASSVKSMMTKIAWQVVTNTTTTVPFDFCIKDVVVIQ